MNHLELVQKTIADLGEEMEKTIVLFYQRLFELDPSLRSLFHNDLKVQQAKFLDTLNFIIEELDSSRNIAEPVQQLGLRHRYYGVQDAHYQTVAVALIWALEQSLGGSFTNEVRVAWQQTYYLLAELMKKSN